MNLICLFGHQWNGCKCKRCGKAQDIGHNYAIVNGKCIEKCIECGKERNLEHKWIGCKCEHCGAIRDEKHNWTLLSGKCIEKCVICGKERNIEHKWNGCKCERCGTIRDKGHKWDEKQCKNCSAPNPNTFYLKVSNKYTAFGGIFAEGEMEYGQLSVGDSVYVYSEKGKLKYENMKVVMLINEGIKKRTVKMGEGMYTAIMLEEVRYFSDIEYKDIISKEKLKFDIPPQETPLVEEKILPQAKTYNHADRNTHIKMATNDLAGICASMRLASHREWIRNVGQDLYNVHGFNAMQEVFINVKTRYPEAQSQLSSIWDGVGGWAD